MKVHLQRPGGLFVSWPGGGLIVSPFAPVVPFVSKGGRAYGFNTETVHIADEAIWSGEGTVFSTAPADDLELLGNVLDGSLPVKVTAHPVDIWDLEHDRADLAARAAEAVHA